MMNTMINAREANARANEYLMTKAAKYVEEKVMPMIYDYSLIGHFHTIHFIKEETNVDVVRVVNILEELGYKVETKTITSTFLKIKWGDEDIAEELETIYVEKYDDFFDSDEEDIII